MAIQRGRKLPLSTHRERRDVDAAIVARHNQRRARILRCEEVRVAVGNVGRPALVRQDEYGAARVACEGGGHSGLQKLLRRAVTGQRVDFIDRRRFAIRDEDGPAQVGPQHGRRIQNLLRQPTVMAGLQVIHA